MKKVYILGIIFVYIFSSQEHCMIRRLNMFDNRNKKGIIGDFQKCVSVNSKNQM